MPEELTTDTSGLTRTPDGTLNNPSIAPEPTPSTTPTPPPTDGTILNKDADALAEAAPPKDAPKPAEAPKEYAEYKVPEGYELDPEAKNEANALFKGMNLTQEQAQSLVDFWVAKTTEAFQAPYKAYSEMTKTWLKEAQDHPDLRGKLGPGQEVNVRIARALDSLGDPKLVTDFRSLMDLSGAGNNQAFIRVIDKLAQRAVEGTAVNGRGPAAVEVPGQSSRPTPAQALYPHLPSVNR